MSQNKCKIYFFASPKTKVTPPHTENIVFWHISARSFDWWKKNQLKIFPHFFSSFKRSIFFSFFIKKLSTNIFLQFDVYVWLHEIYVIKSLEVGKCKPNYSTLFIYDSDEIPPTTRLLKIWKCIVYEQNEIYDYS